MAEGTLDCIACDVRTEDIIQAALEAPRTARAYLPWVEAKIQQLGETADGRLAIRFRRGRFEKKLVEEALPLAIFASKHYRSSRCVTIKHRIGNQKFDAEIIDRRIRRSPFRYVEVTQAHEGENEHYRMIALERNGHVSALGAVTKSGTKRKGITVEVENEAKSHEAVHRAELERIAAAVCRKSKKDYKGDVALVVAFDDSIAFDSDEDLNSLKEFASRNLLGCAGAFRWLALVGWGKRRYLEFDLTR